MPVLSVYVEDRDLASLREAAEELGRSVDDLAEAAVSESANEWRRSRPAQGSQE